MRLDKASRDHHFPAERLSFSGEAVMMEIEGDATTNSLYVSIKHIMVIISRLRGLPLVRPRQKSLRAS